MSTWQDLERRFTELGGALPVGGLRLDRQWSEGRPCAWSVAGGASDAQKSSFRSLSTLAGRMLSELDPVSLTDEILTERDPFRRWLLLVWRFGNPQVETAIEKLDDGTERPLLSGTLSDPAAVAAAACLQIHAVTLPVSSSLAAQLSAARYEGVLRHWEKAQAFFFGDAPDLENAAKEAVSAVEAMAQLVTRSPKARLGDSVKHLRSRGVIHAPLLKGLEEVWGYTCEASGVRHGSATARNLTRGESRYVFDQCSAALRLLLSLDGAA